MKQPVLSPKLFRIRKRIDALDRRMLLCVAMRLKLARQIAREKKRLGVPIVDKIREHQLIADRQKIGKSLGVSKSFIRKLFNTVITESKRQEEKTL